MNSHLTLISGVLTASFAGAVCLMPLAILFARRFGVIDMPHARKVHSHPIPRVGGMAFALSTAAVTAGGLWVLHAYGWQPPDGVMDQWIVVGTVLGFIFTVGLVDDIRTVSSRFKALSLVAVALALGGIGLKFDSILLGGGREPLSLGFFAWPVTVLWLVGIATAVNFIDGLDGLCGGIGVLASGVLAGVLLLGGHIAAAMLPLALCGALLGFLVFNTNPARVFMGDSGSLFIGVTLVISMLMANPRVGSMKGVLLPCLALIIPITDTGLTLLRRKFVQRQSIFSAERGHIHHHLLDMGLTQRHAVGVIYGVSCAAVTIGIIAMLADGWATLSILTLLVPLMYGLLRFAGSYRTRTMVSAVRRKRFIDRVYRHHETLFQELQLKFRSARDFQSWWAAVCHAAEAFQFLSLELPILGRNGKPRQLEWRPVTAESTDPAGATTLSAKVPIRDRRSSQPLEASVELKATDSLELAGHRLALFSRLMSEHAVADLEDTRGTGAGHDEWHNVWKEGLSALNHTRGKAVTTHALNPESKDSQTLLTPATPDDRVAAPEPLPISLGMDRLIAAVRGFTARRRLAREHRAAARFANPRDLLSEPTRAASSYDPDNPLAGLRIAVVHDFLYVYAGAERVLEQMIQLMPQCEVFALFDFLAEDSREFLAGKKVTTSFIQKLPLARRKHRAYLPFMPLAIEQLDLSGYDLVVSSSYLAAKGVITGPDQLHVCYCHSPARYAWDLQHQYLQRQRVGFGPKGMLARGILQYIRTWDARSAMGVDHFVANSQFIARRIRKVYRRPAEVIYPPVDTELFKPGDERADFYLTVSRLVPYKRIDIIVEAFNLMPDKKLVVVGDGPLMSELRKIANDNITLVGHQSEAELLRYMQLAKAFVFAAEEDFGIVPVEAMSCGIPVIAYGLGGVRETVRDGETGIFFDQQTAQSVVNAVRRFETQGLTNDTHSIRERAEQYTTKRFQEQLKDLLESKWRDFAAAKQQDELRLIHTVPESGHAIEPSTDKSAPAHTTPAPTPLTTETRPS